MIIREKRVLILVVIILITLLTNILFAEHKKIDEIIFFDHQYEVVYQGDYTFMNLYYIENHSEKREVIDIEFKDQEFYMYVEDAYRYELPFYNVVRISMRFANLDTFNEILLLGESVITFSDAESKKIDIGTIYLMPWKENDIGQMEMSRSSSTDFNVQTYGFDVPVEILNINSQLDLLLEGQLLMHIKIDEPRVYNSTFENEEDISLYQPINNIKWPLSADRRLYLGSKFETHKASTIVEMILKCDILNEDGALQHLYIKGMNHLPEFTSETVEAVIKESTYE